MRTLSDAEAKRLKAGDEHYLAYVGPPERYDLLGAMQFRLLTTMGLREHHRLLDFGCGSLRAGKLFIPYLQPENYFGIDPNNWLIEDGISKHLGQDLVRLKRPAFANNSDFTIPFQDFGFDFILAQSIFSHSGVDIVEKLLREFARVLAEGGLVAATFSLSKNNRDFDGAGWIYPGCVRYREDTITAFAERAGLAAKSIPFYHPSQRWFLMARDERLLPTAAQMPLLGGAVFNVEEFAPSIRAVGGGAS